MSRSLTPSLAASGVTLKKALVVLSGVALITLGAKLQVPFWPVPMTMHSLAVMVVALAAGPRLGAATVLAYLAAGAVGLPVFSGTPERGIGLPYMVGPTGGYLLGFVACAWLTGTLAQGRGVLGRALAMLAGLAVVFVCGLAWLAVYVPAEQVLTVGFLPFILGDLLSIAVVALGAQAVPAHLLGRIGQ